MFALSIRELADLLPGELLLSDMPPLGGDQELVRRIVLESKHVRPGDIYWALPDSDAPQFAEAAFLRSALGVVSEGRLVMPWAGAFSLKVADTIAAVERFAAHVRQQFRGPVVLVVQDAATPSLAPAIVATAELKGAVTLELQSPRDVSLALWGLSPLAAVTILECPAEKSLFLKILQLCRPTVAVINSPAFDTSLAGPVIVPTILRPDSGSSDARELVLSLCDHWEIDRTETEARYAAHLRKSTLRQCRSGRECAVVRKVA